MAPTAWLPGSDRKKFATAAEASVGAGGALERGHQHGLIVLHIRRRREARSGTGYGWIES